MECKVNISVGKDKIGAYLEHSLEVDSVGQQITRHYYKEVEEAIIINMPSDILMNLYIKCKKELDGRKLC